MINILFIDSDNLILEDISRVFSLETAKFKIAIANSGNEGFGLFGSFNPNVVVINNPLYDVETKNMVSNFKQNNPYVNIIVTMETDNPMLSSEFIQLGANDILIKPYSINTLIDKINKITSQSGQMSSPNYSQQPMPNYPQQPMPNYPQQPMPNYPQQPMPNYPQQPMPNYPQQPMPNYSQQPMPNYPQQPSFGMQETARMGQGHTLKQKIIAVNCPKGGVGKTTISKELSVLFSTVNLNGSPLKVLLVDLDIDFGDVSVMLGLSGANKNIAHLAAHVRELLKMPGNNSYNITIPQHEFVQKYVLEYKTGLHVLAAPFSHNDSIEITSSEIEVILNNIRNYDYDIVILDTGNNTSGPTILALEKAQEILMVVTLDHTSLSDTSMLLITFDAMNFDKSKIKLLINRVPVESLKQTDDIKAIQDFLRLDLIGILPEYPKIRQMNNDNSPVVLESKQNEYSRSVMSIANKISPVFNKQLSQKTKSINSNKSGGFFSRLFKKK